MATSGSGDFEAALARLEEIVQKLERESVSLDDSVKLFKEGKLLAARCEELLKVAQSAIETAAAPPQTPASASSSAASASSATLFSRDPVTRVRLDDAVAARAGVTRSRARSLIIAGRVRVDGNPATKPGSAIATTATLEVERPRPFVSRGGEKLEGALHDLALDVAGLRALDVGASTGGFTDCLLQRGAAHVTALDVGYGQIAVTLRDDARVRVIERTNFRTLPNDALPEGPFDLVVIDASFISVIPLLDRTRSFLAEGGRIVALVKPQFEAGVDRLGRGGVVRDADVHRAILREFRDATVGMGLVPQKIVASHLRGPAGNVEFFASIARDGTAVDDEAIDVALAGVPA